MIRTQQPAQQKQDREQTADQNRDERRQQNRTTSSGSLGRDRIQNNCKQDREQKEPCEHCQSGLESCAIRHLNWPAYHSTSGAPKSSAATAPRPRKTPNGSNICMFRSPLRAIKAIPIMDPVRTPTKIVRIVSRQPR